MDEDISIINSKTRNEKIKEFFVNYKKILIGVLSSIILILLIFFSYGELQERKNKRLAEKYNNITIEFNASNKLNVKNELIEIINEKNSTYSPLALYFIIDNEIKSSNEEINKFFDIIINQTSLDKEIKNLIIYKKGLFNSNFETENNLINILNPIIKSDSVWKSHALYLLAEYFFDKNQKEKAKEFYNQILNSENSNENILKEAQKRLSRDLSE
tara:strand:+ start:2081 stop:2725 length:645 start_codon:yes stop_codon:yes gene_type:complete